MHMNKIEPFVLPVKRASIPIRILQSPFDDGEGKLATSFDAAPIFENYSAYVVGSYPSIIMVF